eukprot:gnl/MRDRNA2_/MRDRNA2_17732_c0_seq1.p1 gnl/MRDRNA2_/MRDRNA2_17732_c0~~gnl/MRDRNA2_/MRDRNA2_17732_c0_seq1.p1  ORF type:complete len:846 (+),score=172.42 gnl/MRDRNA2_/MRDRNA2_17732_c0_seq1:328-2538(+)
MKALQDRIHNFMGEMEAREKLAAHGPLGLAVQESENVTDIPMEYLSVAPGGLQVAVDQMQETMWGKEATAIQSAYRGHVARKESRQLQDEKLQAQLQMLQSDSMLSNRDHMEISRMSLRDQIDSEREAVLKRLQDIESRKAETTVANKDSRGGAHHPQPHHQLHHQPHHHGSQHHHPNHPQHHHHDHHSHTPSHHQPHHQPHDQQHHQPHDQPHRQPHHQPHHQHHQQHQQPYEQQHHQPRDQQHRQPHDQQHHQPIHQPHNQPHHAPKLQQHHQQAWQSEDTGEHSTAPGVLTTVLGIGRDGTVYNNHQGRHPGGHHGTHESNHGSSSGYAIESPSPPAPPPSLEAAVAPPISSGLVGGQLPVSDPMFSSDGTRPVTEAPPPPVPPPSVLSEQEKMQSTLLQANAQSGMPQMRMNHQQHQQPHQQHHQPYHQPYQQRQYQQQHHQPYQQPPQNPGQYQLHQQHEQHQRHQQHQPHQQFRQHQQHQQQHQFQQNHQCYHRAEEIPTAPSGANAEGSSANMDSEAVALIDGLLAGLRSALQNPQRYEGVQHSGKGSSLNAGPLHASSISHLGRALAKLPGAETGIPPHLTGVSRGGPSFPSSAVVPPRTPPVAKPTVSARHTNPSEPNVHQPPLRTKKQRRDLREYLEGKFGSVARGFDTLVRTVLPDMQDQNERMTYKLNEEEFYDALRRTGYEQARRTAKDSGWWDGLVEATDMDGDELISIQDVIDALLISTAD